MTRLTIIGAGPAGLATAYELLQHDRLGDFDIDIYEMDRTVGGIAKTLQHNGYRFDLGGHRFYTKFPEIEAFYGTFLGSEMLTRPRLSRIYYEKRFYDYPLSASNALGNLGLRRASLIVLSWLARQFNRHKQEKTFDQWVSNRFGDRLFQIFFKSYTEKVWGIPTSELSADWAAQRIQNFDLLKAMINAVFKINPGSRTIITTFHYPKYGPGMLYERMAELLVSRGARIHLNHEVMALDVTDGKVSSVVVRNGVDNTVTSHEVDRVVSTMPLDKLVKRLSPPPVVKEHVDQLKFRNFISVNLIIENNPFPDQWIYVHDPSVRVGRIQNFRNWSPYMVKEGETATPIAMEYFASEGDSLWTMRDEDLVALGKDEIVKIGLARRGDIREGFVQRVPNAYPVYNFNYQRPLEAAKQFLTSFTNLHLCGRGGLFRYNNQDHSILTGFYAGRNILAGYDKHDVWGVNEQKDYIEEK